MDQENAEHHNSNTGLGIGGLLLLGLIWWWFWGKSVTWQGFYYPNAEDLTRDIKSPIFKTLDECRDWVDSMVYKYNPSGTGYDYECGKNCKKEEGMFTMVCETTEQ